MGRLYVSYHQVMRLTGFAAGMSAKDRKEMEKARKDLAKAKQQLEDMRDGAGKTMAMRIMEPQIQKFERMAAAGAFEAETHVVTSRSTRDRPASMGPGIVCRVGGVHGGADLCRRSGERPRGYGWDALHRGAAAGRTPGVHRSALSGSVLRQGPALMVRFR